MLAGTSQMVQQALCTVTILGLRWGALRYGWHLPEMKERDTPTTQS